MLCGLVLNNITNIDPREVQEKNDIYFAHIFWLTTALCIGSSMHIMVTCMYVVIYGGGLALRGQLGSMSFAVEGMKVEQNWMLNIFNLSMYCFGLSNVAVYYLILDSAPAYLGSFIMAVFMVMWYLYTLRIYNRFKFDAVSTTFQNSDDSKVMHAKFEGFLRAKEIVAESALIKNPWIRRYFVLVETELYYCDRKDDYLRDGLKACKERPISLPSYTLMDKEQRTANEYHISLIPRIKDAELPWELLSETEDEYISWKSAIQAACTITGNISARSYEENDIIIR